MTGSNSHAEAPRGKKRKKKKEVNGGGTVLAGLGFMIINLFLLLLAQRWLGSVLTGIPERMLDRIFIAAVFGVIVTMNANPEGWRDMLRLAAGTLLFNAIAALVMLVASVALVRLLSPDVLKTYADELAWVQVFPVFMLMLPSQPALARIGLLPGFRWRAEEPGSPGEDEASAGPPAWYPPGFGRRLPAILAIFGFVLIGDGLFERLALIWPNSFLSTMNSKLVLFTVATGGFGGFFWKRDGGWLALLAATLAGAVTSCGVMAVFGLALFFLWPGIPASILDILLILLLLFGIFLVAHRESRDDKKKPIPDVNGPAESNAP